MSIEAIKQMVDALQDLKDDCSGCEFEWQNDYPLQCVALEAGLKAIAEAEKQEPVGEVKDLFTNAAWEQLDVRGSTKVYLESPPQRQSPNNYDRWNGVDIQFRRGGTGWPKPYRVRVMPNKNERADYRVTVFCDTLDEAIKAAHGIEKET